MPAVIGAKRMLIGIAAFVLGSVASYAIFAVRGEPFGTINDIGNGLAGGASGALAWQLRSRPPLGDGATQIATAAGVAGAVLAMGDSVLVISKATGFLLAGFVSTIGFGLVGVWLVDYNRSLRARADVPGRLTTLGIATGAVMASGLSAVPAAVLRYDDFETAPAWTWLGFAGWVGTYFLLPIWCIWAARSIQFKPSSRS
jgi:hypothetical protein